MEAAAFDSSASDDAIRLRCTQLKAFLELYRPLSDGADARSRERAHVALLSVRYP